MPASSPWHPCHVQIMLRYRVSRSVQSRRQELLGFLPPTCHCVPLIRKLGPYGSGVRTWEEDATLAELLHPLASLFVPLFFVLMGIQVDLRSLLSLPALGFGAVLILCAFLGKLACALAVLREGTNRLAVAIGMIPRG